MAAAKTDSISGFKKFLADNKIAGTAAGVIIAFASKDLIASIVHDIIFPLLHAVFIAFSITNKVSTTLLKQDRVVNVMAFLRQLLTYIIILVSTYMFLQFTFSYLLNV
jgi:large-conductance mechanosensitive channel